MLISSKPLGLRKVFRGFEGWRLADMFSVFWWPIIGVGALAGDVLRVGRGNFEADRRGLPFDFLLMGLAWRCCSSDDGSSSS